MMISYIINYQNSYVYSHLFENNLVDLLRKAVMMKDLFESNVFNHTFDFDEWPATNSNTEKLMNPYNRSMFAMRFEYPAIFPNIWKADEKKQQLEMAGKFDTNKENVFKIKYNLNILPSVSEQQATLMQAISDSEELSIFTTPLIQDLIDYKWDRFAFQQHLMGAVIHIIYVIVLIIYIKEIFLDEEVIYMKLVQPDNTDIICPFDKNDDSWAEGCIISEDIGNADYICQYDELNSNWQDGCLKRNPEPRAIWLYIIQACLIYPLFYDGTQACKQGSAYLNDVWNYLDLLHIFAGYYNIYSQFCVGTWEMSSKIVIIMVTIFCLLKTFFFMRIVKSFSYIVTMIMNVVADLRIFMIFFFILIMMFSMIFDVIAPNKADEYKYVGYYWGNILTTLRLSLGDFDFSVLSATGPDELSPK